MSITAAIITPEAQSQFNTDMFNHHFKREHFSTYESWAEWQGWMLDFEEGNELTEHEINTIKAVQRKMWDAFWEEADKAIEKAKDTYNGFFVELKSVEWNNVYPHFTLNGDEFRFYPNSYNGEYYHGWNVRTQEDFAVRDVNLELEDNLFVDLGYVVYPWSF